MAKNVGVLRVGIKSVIRRLLGKVKVVEVYFGGNLGFPFAAIIGRR